MNEDRPFATVDMTATGPSGDAATPSASEPASEGARPGVGALPRPVPIGEQEWPEGTVPLVSICCITYNHGPFIRQCLDGFLMQETTFPVEILIHDDASNDGTADIVRAYCAAHPRLFKPVLQSENQYLKRRKKFKPNLMFNYPRAQGRYIALCEGDDCWTAPHKLQTQVAFLEANAEYSASFHDVIRHVDGGGPGDNTRYVGSQVKPCVTLRDIVLVNFVPTAGVVFRADTVRHLPQWYPLMPVGDWPLHVLNAQRGHLRYFDEIWGVYRVHAGGIWSSLGEVERLRKNILLAQTFNRHLCFEHADLLGPKLTQWRYELACMLGDTAPRWEVIKLLLAALRYPHAKVPRSEVTRLLFQSAWPWLYDRIHWRWRRARRVLRREGTH